MGCPEIRKFEYRYFSIAGYFRPRTVVNNQAESAEQLEESVRIAMPYRDFEVSMLIQLPEQAFAMHAGRYLGKFSAMQPGRFECPTAIKQ